MDSALPNKHARFSLVSAIFTLLFFCIGFAPFLPMTAIVCYPAALASGILSLVSGLRGLRHSSGHWMAWIGIFTGILVILGVVAFTTLTALLLPVLTEGISEIWQSIRP